MSYAEKNGTGECAKAFSSIKKKRLELRPNNYHHQPNNVPTAEAQAFLMDYT
jgi:hypothetical protein